MVGQRLIDALSYGGSIIAAQLSGIGSVSLVEGPALSSSVLDKSTEPGSLARVPNGSDTNNAATDWVISSTPTPGAANVP